MSVTPEAERVISGFHGAGKPLALCCIAPILAAKVMTMIGIMILLRVYAINIER